MRDAWADSHDALVQNWFMFLFRYSGVRSRMNDVQNKNISEKHKSLHYDTTNIKINGNSENKDPTSYLM